jgi:hypothetical protein
MQNNIILYVFYLHKISPLARTNHAKPTKSKFFVSINLQRSDFKSLFLPAASTLFSPGMIILDDFARPKDEEIFFRFVLRASKIWLKIED